MGLSCNQHWQGGALGEGQDKCQDKTHGHGSVITAIPTVTLPEVLQSQNTSQKEVMAFIAPG
jgi:hypothetical protein